MEDSHQKIRCLEKIDENHKGGGGKGGCDDPPPITPYMGGAQNHLLTSPGFTTLWHLSHLGTREEKIFSVTEEGAAQQWGGRCMWDPPPSPPPLPLPFTQLRSY